MLIDVSTARGRAVEQDPCEAPLLSCWCLSISNPSPMCFRRQSLQLHLTTPLMKKQAATGCKTWPHVRLHSSLRDRDLPWPLYHLQKSCPGSNAIPHAQVWCWTDGQSVPDKLFLTKDFLYETLRSRAEWLKSRFWLGWIENIDHTKNAKADLASYGSSYETSDCSMSIIPSPCFSSGSRVTLEGHKWPLGSVWCRLGSLMLPTEP